VIEFILLSLPIFGVVSLGWMATRAGITSAAALDALGIFSFRFALPALLFRLITSQPLDRSFNATFYGGYLASGLLIFGLVFGVSLVLNRRAVASAGARATTATFSNLGFLGPPLILAYLGERGTGPMTMVMLSESTILLSLGSIIMGVYSGRAAGLGSLLLRGTLLNPVVVAIGLGAGFALAGISLSPVLGRFLGFLGGAAGPTALFALGGALALQRVDRTTAFSAAAITTAKLVMYPTVTWYVLAQVLGVEALWTHAGVLISALPSAGSNYVLAQRYAADSEHISAAIVLSTVLSAVTVPFVAWLVLS
jgi:malonate transporter and related proteins